MKIEKAIEILTQLPGRAIPTWDKDKEDALKLGVEALKRVQIHRFYNKSGKNILLPSEIEE